MLASKKKISRVVYWQVDEFVWDYGSLLQLCFLSSHCLDLLLEDPTTSSTIRAAFMKVTPIIPMEESKRLAKRGYSQTSLALWMASDCKILHPSSTSCVNCPTVILIKELDVMMKHFQQSMFHEFF
jgi:hypothetical protein